MKARGQAVTMGVLLVLTGSAAAFTPWDPLVNDSWVYFGPPQSRLTMHTVNGGDYEVGFDQARNDHGARGMNALRFSSGGTNVGHLSTSLQTGSFGVGNVGDARSFTDLLILVAIDAPALPADFAMSLGAAGSARQFDPTADFGFYEHPEYSAGRPSGYYSATSPAGEDIAYDFDAGMVSVYAAQDVSLGPGGSVMFDYAFEHLPGRAVFSVYGFDAGLGWIYHSNRGVIDAHNAAGSVSTFEVIPEPAVIWLMLAGIGRLLSRRHA